MASAKTNQTTTYTLELNQDEAQFVFDIMYSLISGKRDESRRTHAQSIRLALTDADEGFYSRSRCDDFQLNLQTKSVYMLSPEEQEAGEPEGVW